MSGATQRKRFLRQNWKLVSVMAIALGVAGWFAFNFVATFVYLQDPRHRDGDLKDWMTTHFVIEMYDLPRPVVQELLARPPGEGGIKLGHAAKDLGLTMEELTERVRAGAALYREQAQ